MVVAAASTIPAAQRIWRLRLSAVLAWEKMNCGYVVLLSHGCRGWRWRWRECCVRREDRRVGTETENHPAGAMLKRVCFMELEDSLL
jgi:hypothetical protein